MKVKKTYIPYALLMCSFTVCAQATLQKPFSPCKTDKPRRIFFHNDFKQAFIVYSPPTHAISASEEIPIEEAISQVTVQVNKKILEQGKELEIIPTKPLQLSIKAPIKILTDYIVKNDLLSSDILNYIDENYNTVKKTSTALIKYATWLFSNKKPEELYRENRKAIVYAWARAYRNTFGIFGAMCEVKLTLTPERIMQLVDDPTNPVIDFHDIFDEIMYRLDGSSGYSFNKDLRNPVITML